MCGMDRTDPLEGPRTMKIASQADGLVTVLSISGRIDFTTSDDLERAACAVIAGGSPRVIFDMRGVDYVSSAGLRAILIAARAAKSAGGGVAIACLQPAVEEVFATSGFGKIVPISENSAAARRLLNA